MSEREALAKYEAAVKPAAGQQTLSFAPPPTVDRSMYGTVQSVQRENQLPVFTPPAPNPDPLAAFEAFKAGKGSSAKVLPRQAEYLLGAGCQGDEPGYQTLIIDPASVGLDWATCPACDSQDTDFRRDSHGRIIYSIFAASTGQLGVRRAPDFERLAMMGPECQCNEQGCRRKFPVTHIESLKNAPVDFIQQCTPLELKGIPDGSRERELVTRRFLGLLKRLARGSTESAESYLKSATDLEGVRYEQRCILYNKALGRVKRAVNESIDSGAHSWPLVKRGPQLLKEQLQHLQQELAACAPVPEGQQFQLQHYGTSLPRIGTFLKRLHRMLIEEAPDKRRELQAVKVGSHFSMDDCPAIAKSFSIGSGGGTQLSLMGVTSANSHELATAILLPHDKAKKDKEGNALGGIAGKRPALQALAVRVDGDGVSSFDGAILTTDNQPTNRQDHFELFKPKLIGQARDLKHLMDDVNETLNKYSSFYAEFMGRFKRAFLYEHEPTKDALQEKLTTAGGFPKGAQITISVEPPEGAPPCTVVTKVKTWKANDSIDAVMAQRMRDDHTLSKTFKKNIPKLRRPRGIVPPETDREGFVDARVTTSLKSVRELLVELLIDLRGEGERGKDWGIDRTDANGNAQKPEYLWLRSREASVKALESIVHNLDIYVLPDAVAAKVSRNVIQPEYGSGKPISFATDREMLTHLGRLLAGTSACPPALPHSCMREHQRHLICLPDYVCVTAPWPSL